MYPSDEGRLISALLSRFRPYKKFARPVRNASATVTVHFGLDLQQILDLDQKEQVLETRIWKEYVSMINWFWLVLRSCLYLIGCIKSYTRALLSFYTSYS